MGLGGSLREHARETPDGSVNTSGRTRHAPRDRVLKWVTAIAAACLGGFVVYVVVQGPTKPSAPDSTALKSPPPPVLEAGTTAPAFTLSPLGSGGPVTLSAFRGRPVIVNFFASWCPDCRQELAAVASVARAESGKVAVVGVDSNESSETTAARLLTAAHATYPVGLDPDAKVATAYLVNALPVTYFLDADGKVVGSALGPQAASTLERWAVRLQHQDSGTQR